MRGTKLLRGYKLTFQFQCRLHPIFLGGVNVASGMDQYFNPDICFITNESVSGNKPPWTLPAKAAYGKFDMQRACNYFGTPENKTPDFFPILSIMVNIPRLLITKHVSMDKC